MLSPCNARWAALAIAAAAWISPSPASADESRWVAALPFGAGQFQRGDTALGAFFLSTQLAAGATSIASAITVGVLSSHESPTTWERERLNTGMRRATAINRVSFTVWASLAAVGIVEAQLRIAPRRPPSDARAPTWTPAIVPVPGGLVLGVGGAF
jgi:hypothetical protein